MCGMHSSAGLTPVDVVRLQHHGYITATMAEAVKAEAPQEKKREGEFLGGIMNQLDSLGVANPLISLQKDLTQIIWAVGNELLLVVLIPLWT